MGPDGNLWFTETSSDQVAVILELATADLVLTKSASIGTLTPGATFDYILTVQNNGPNAATAVVVTDDLPPEVSFQSSSCGATEAAGVVTWNVGTLAIGASASCALTVQLVELPPQVVNSASAAGEQTDPTPEDATAQLVLSISVVVIPTLGEVALLALAVLLAASAVFVLRRG